MRIRWMVVAACLAGGALGGGCGTDGGASKADAASAPDVAGDATGSPDGAADVPDIADGPLRRVPVVTGLASAWDALSHRFSRYEVTFAPTESGGVVSVRNDGGPWGALDASTLTVDVTPWRSRRLVAVPASVSIAIPPGAEVDGVPFSAVGEIAIDAGPLGEATARVALLRGFAISTDDYDAPPAFETDPTLPYDPSHGFTSLGLGIALGEPVADGATLRVPVRVRNSLGPADRADMNAAIPQATTWLRVDALLVGALGAGAAAARGTTSYDISSPTWGSDTPIDHAPADAQRVSVAGAPGPAAAVFGVSRFDFWLNQDGHHDPACVVASDPENYLGEPVSGPGRYIRYLTVRVADGTYDPGTGAGAARLDLFLSNQSVGKEVGNLCLRAEGEVAMLQVDDPDAAPDPTLPVSVSVPSGEPGTQTVTLD